MTLGSRTRQLYFSSPLQNTYVPAKGQSWSAYIAVHSGVLGLRSRICVTFQRDGKPQTASAVCAVGNLWDGTFLLHKRMIVLRCAESSTRMWLGRCSGKEMGSIILILCTLSDLHVQIMTEALTLAALHPNGINPQQRFDTLSVGKAKRIWIVSYLVNPVSSQMFVFKRC